MQATLGIAVGGVACLLLYPLVRWFFAPVVVAKHFLKTFDPKKQWTYRDPITSKRLPFPSLSSAPTCYLSIIVPAYNESERILPMLHDTIAYMDTRAKSNAGFMYEIIVVDDCSTDTTIKVVESEIKRVGANKLKILALDVNRGKGGAVRCGVMRAAGELILMVDADNATQVADFDKLEAIWLKDSYPQGMIVCGSRAHLQKEAMAKRHPLRNILMHGFHMIVSTLCVKQVQDTQCGFKLFDRKAAQLIFPPLHIERWGFDVELLYLAFQRKISVHEVAVHWQEIPGSKLDVVSATFSMLREMLLIPFCYNFGIWKVDDGAVRLL
ncbi:unnamed protein product [Aphanomyces euteiches]|uniref:dolichyl-phosphate beta-glucosyltransferase n=1 Tax=Aphanomyces euteiches TaxID=100861 RepID=A0A6G0WE35_9STRA|nr:hypothetical protein Ae201684_015931 [Aphanomyces euteiches]KAH9088384.1 hypothetical protein Ae201684P_003078 [Aphanomyces euteiches]KAH9107072.1 hypothetical protein AeMF1_017462 [Aphanomyces euteiches]KAH9129939.1 hypothetical protein LEN26_008966 [Aphanomyces euteiches]KAH9152834.1 hypothetical protein AeRB84_004811 [Aphanomyces euteiches]